MDELVKLAHMQRPKKSYARLGRGKEILSVERLKEYLNYDELSGLFTRKVDSYPARVGDRVGYTQAIGYQEVSLLGKRYYLHRLAWFYTYGVWPKSLDHVNGDKSDNRLSNLREATHSENMRNKATPVRSKTGITGVCLDKSTNSYKATIGVGGKLLNIGRYPTIELASAAREEAELKYFGEFRHIKEREVV